MNAKAFILPILLLVGYASAETRTYLVYRAGNFPQDRYLLTASPQEYKYFIDTGKKDISDAGGQPFRTTRYEINYSGVYALWTVDGNPDDLPHIKTMEDKGYIVLLSSEEVVDVEDVTKGGSHKEMQETVLLTVPTDYYQVTVSTGA